MRWKNQEHLRWLATVLRERRRLLLWPGIKQEQIWPLFIRALDGDEPHEFPELVAAFFRGQADPLLLARRVFNNWLWNGKYDFGSCVKFDRQHNLGMEDQS